MDYFGILNIFFVFKDDSRSRNISYVNNSLLINVSWGNNLGMVTSTLGVIKSRKVTFLTMLPLMQLWISEYHYQYYHYESISRRQEDSLSYFQVKITELIQMKFGTQIV